MDSISLATVTALLTRLGSECTEGRASEADKSVWARIKGLFGLAEEPDPQDLPKTIAMTLNNDQKLLSRLVKLLSEAKGTDPTIQMIGSLVEHLAAGEAVGAVKFDRPRRDRVVSKAAVLAGGSLAFVSLVIGVALRYLSPACVKPIGYVLVALWALGPPIWFWLEWSFLTNNFDETEISNLKHSHSLSATVWVAIAAVLAVLFEIPPFK